MTQVKSKTKATKQTRLYVLDTNVLMHDPMSLFRFEEHDVYLPMITLEELDDHKKGMTEVARNARQVSRDLDALSSLAAVDAKGMPTGAPLSTTGHRTATGKLFFQTTLLGAKTPTGLPDGKADNQILGVVEALRKMESGREVILVSKDINMRVKARALGLPTEDYENDKVLGDGDVLYSGALELPKKFWGTYDALAQWRGAGGRTCYRIRSDIHKSMLENQFVYCEDAEPHLYARVSRVEEGGCVIEELDSYLAKKKTVMGISARNHRQNFAFNLLMDPDVDFVSLLGKAGSGKTLLALAAGLAQTAQDQRYNQIIITRATVSVGDDIGFLPGNEEEKMSPWMGAFEDNLEVINSNESLLTERYRSKNRSGGNGEAQQQKNLREHIKFKSMSFMRGRTFLDKFVIVDEAQNLTPKQTKTLITRAGPGTKMVFLGNLAQIDTPYLTEGSSGLTHVVEHFKGWPHGGHITLLGQERSRLAGHAEDVL